MEGLYNSVAVGERERGRWLCMVVSVEGGEGGGRITHDSDSTFGINICLPEMSTI